jgi:hypothetical protein
MNFFFLAVRMSGWTANHVDIELEFVYQNSVLTSLLCNHNLYILPVLVFNLFKIIKPNNMSSNYYINICGL